MAVIKVAGEMFDEGNKKSDFDETSQTSSQGKSRGERVLTSPNTVEIGELEAISEKNSEF